MTTIIEYAWRNDCGEVRSVTGPEVAKALAQRYNGEPLSRVVTYGEFSDFTKDAQPWVNGHGNRRSDEPERNGLMDWNCSQCIFWYEPRVPERSSSDPTKET